MIHLFRFLQDWRILHHPAVPQLKLPGSSKWDSASGRWTCTKQWILPGTPSHTQRAATTNRTDVRRSWSLKSRIPCCFVSCAKLRARNESVHWDGRTRVSSRTCSKFWSRKTHHKGDVSHQFVLTRLGTCSRWAGEYERNRKNRRNSSAKRWIQHTFGTNSSRPHKSSGNWWGNCSMSQRQFADKRETWSNNFDGEWQRGVSSE